MKRTYLPSMLLESYDYSAEHWGNLWTTNLIEPTFVTVLLRQRVAGRGSRAAGIALAFKLIEFA